MGKSRYKIVSEGEIPYFLTCTIVEWMPLFGNPAIAAIIIDSLRFLHERRRMSLHALRHHGKSPSPDRLGG